MPIPGHRARGWSRCGLKRNCSRWKPPSSAPDSRSPDSSPSSRNRLAIPKSPPRSASPTRSSQRCDATSPPPSPRRPRHVPARWLPCTKCGWRRATSTCCCAYSADTGRPGQFDRAAEYAVSSRYSARYATAMCTLPSSTRPWHRLSPSNARHSTRSAHGSCLSRRRLAPGCCRRWIRHPCRRWSVNGART